MYLALKCHWPTITKIAPKMIGYIIKICHTFDTQQNRFRNEHGIKAVGRHIPAALQEFSELVTRYNLSQPLVDTVTQCGYTEPTPVQRQAVPCMLEVSILKLLRI